MALSLDRPYSLIEIIINIPLARLLAGGHGSSCPERQCAAPGDTAAFWGRADMAALGFVWRC
jgi:hypothetical protein